MTRAAARSRPVSELQTRGPSLLREARKNGSLALTRYGKTVAYLISPDTRDRQEELERAADRAIWAIDLQRAMRDLKRGAVMDWDEIYAELRRELEA